MDNEFEYSIKIWLTAVLLSPLLVAIYLVCESFGSETVGGLIYVFSVSIIFLTFCSFFFSIPSYFLLWFVVHLIYKRVNAPISLMKVIWSAIGVGLTVLPFWLLEQVLPFGDINSFEMLYSGVILAGIWYYRLPPRRELSTEI